MLLIRVCQWIKLRIQIMTKVPVKVIRAVFRKSDKPSSIIPGMFKGQPYQLSFKLIRSANLPLTYPSSTLRNLAKDSYFDTNATRFESCRCNRLQSS